MVRRLVQLLLPFVLALPATAQTNWASFRGPNASGVSTDSVTVTTWDVEKPENIRWKTRIPGLRHSSPVIWGDRVIVTSAVNLSRAAPLKVGLYGDPASADDNDVQQWKVFCLNKKTGKIVWQAVAHQGRLTVSRPARLPSAM